MQVANKNLPIQVTGRHVSVTEAMKDYSMKKIETLHLDYPRIIEAQVILDVEKYRHQAEIILHCANHITIEASAESDDMYKSIDQVIDKVDRQMRKYKTRIMRQHRPRKQTIRHHEEYVYSPEILEQDHAHDHDVQPTLVHAEKYPIKPMFVDEAMLQLEMSNQQFLVFRNAKTENINVIYKRKTGDFGLIDPQGT